MEKVSDIVEREPGIDIEDLEEARSFIREKIENGEDPVVTVPVRYAEDARKGIRPHTTWIFDGIIAGTLGREPYSFGNEERITFRVRLPPEQVEPRFTGPKKHFHGVVVFRGPIAPEYLQPAY